MSHYFFFIFSFCLWLTTVYQNWLRYITFIIFVFIYFQYIHSQGFCFINSIKRKFQRGCFIHKNPFQKRKYRKWFPPSGNRIKTSFWANVGHGVRIDLGLCYTKDIKKIQKVGFRLLWSAQRHRSGPHPFLLKI